jgi:outer membrane protein insertion porin family
MTTSVRLLRHGMAAALLTAASPFALAQEGVASQPAPVPPGPDALADATDQAQLTAIQRIVVEGTQRIEQATVASYLSVAPGDPFDPARIDLSLKTLFATGLFADVVIEQRGGDLVVRVVENPIINQVLFEGNRSLKTENLTKEIQAKPRGVFTPARVQADVQRVIELYRRAGRFAANITPQVKQLPQNRVDLIFEIDEGPVTNVRRVNFLGNRSFSDRELRGEIATEESRWWKFLSSNDNYDPDRLEYDREQLRKFYTNRGYAEFRVVSAVADLTPDQKEFFVTFTIDEGQRYTFGDVTVNTELKKLPADALRAFVPIQTGQLFEADLIEKAIDSITFAAGSAGYAFVDVRPRLDRDRDTQKVNLTFEVDEGPRVYVERIDIKDNTRTVDEVIRREMRIAEGDAFNRVLIDRSKNRIRALGYFKEVEITEKPGSLPDRSIVEVKVEEQPTGELSFAAGFSSVDQFLFELNIQERNLRGRGQFLRLRISTSQRRQNIDIRFTEPRFTGREIAAGFDIFSTRSDFLEEAAFESQTNGFGLRVGFPLSEFSQIGLRYTLRQDDVKVSQQLCDADPTTADPLICSQAGQFLTSVAGYSMVFDRRNDPVRPTRGWDFTLSQDLAGLGGEVKYLRSEFEGAVYRGLWRSVTASLSLAGGYVVGWDDDTVRINDRFFRGGDTFRGFKVAGIGPREFFIDKLTGQTQFGDALGGKAYAHLSGEIRFPLGLPKELGVEGAVFTEVGTLGLLDDADRRRVDSTDYVFGVKDALTVRSSAGVSVFWKSPFGPVRFDFAQPLLKEEYDRTESFRFSTSTQF